MGGRGERRLIREGASRVLHLVTGDVLTLISKDEGDAAFLGSREIQSLRAGLGMTVSFAGYFVRTRSHSASGVT